MRQILIAACLICIAACLICIAAVAVAVPPTPTEKTAAVQTIYQCRPNHYDPPCRKVASNGNFNAREVNEDELRAAWITAISGAATQITPRDKPILQCGNGHGQTACCRIIGTNPIDGTIYIECG